MLLASSGQEWQFHIATDHVVLKIGNFTLLMAYSGQDWLLHNVLASSGQECQFHMFTDI